MWKAADAGSALPRSGALPDGTPMPARRSHQSGLVASRLERSRLVATRRNDKERRAASSPSVPIALADGITVSERTSTGVLSADVSNSVKTFDKVLIGNDTLMFGYPVSLALVPNAKIDFSRPLLGRGIVAGEDLPQHSIILDCPSYQGDSGAAVVEVDAVSPFQRSFYIIGVMSSFVPFADTWKNEHFGYSNTTLENSGYSVIVPMDYVLELMK